MASKSFITNDGVFAESQDDIRMTTLTFEGELKLITFYNIMVRIYYIVEDEQLLLNVNDVVISEPNEVLNKNFKSFAEFCNGLTIDELIERTDNLVHKHRSLVNNTNGYNMGYY